MTHTQRQLAGIAVQLLGTFVIFAAFPVLIFAIMTLVLERSWVLATSLLVVLAAVVATGCAVVLWGVPNAA